MNPKVIGEIKVTVSCVRDCPSPSPLRQPCEVAAFWRKNVETASWYQDEKECCVVFMLDARNTIKSFNLVSLGTLNTSLVHPREVFRPAVLVGAKSIIIAHNHPSGDPEPSAEDIDLTKRLLKAGEIMEIELLDSLVIAGRLHRSMKEQGII